MKIQLKSCWKVELLKSGTRIHKLLLETEGLNFQVPRFPKTQKTKVFSAAKSDALCCCCEVGYDRHLAVGYDRHLAPLPFCLVLPHFAGLHTLSTVLSHVHKGHLADTPRLCNPYVLMAVTVARDDLIHLKHTSGISGSGMRVEVGGWKAPVSPQCLFHQPSFIPPPYCSYSH